MKKTTKLIYHDLREEALAMRLPLLIGRREEGARLTRITNRRINNNALIVGSSGIGKSVFFYGWVRRAVLATNETPVIVQFSSAHLSELIEDETAEERYAEAFSTLPPCTLFIDDFGRHVHRNNSLVQKLQRLYAPLLERPDVHVVCTCEPQEYAWLEREFPSFTRLFEQLALKSQSAAEHSMILAKVLPRLNARHRVVVSDATLRLLAGYGATYPALGGMPQSAIQLLDESLALCSAKKRPVLKEESVAEVLEAKLGIPTSRLAGNDLKIVRTLEADLNARVVNQQVPISTIARTLQRAKLGLRNPDRPLGSFLLLGPSGVGKTETARSVAELLFGTTESFLRFDMSEFQQEHTAQRLIGAPAGYVGFEEGGALTNALKRNPYCLILLDEIEKAHPKVFDMFLQVLDDGRITSGQNETVDARHCVIMATSNAAVADILSAHQRGEDVHEEHFFKTRVLPTLTETFRLEFINRFDSVLVFNPLTPTSLLQIAELEMRKVEARFKRHNVRFEFDREALERQVRGLADARFGARPVKRFIEETCETLLAQSLLGNPAARL